MKRFAAWPWWRAIGLAMVALVNPAYGASQQTIQTTIDSAIKYLYGQETSGTWDPSARDPGRPADLGYSMTVGQWGGQTAIATYALLSAGEDAKDPRLASAIQFLERADIQGVYALGARCLVWHTIPNASSIPAIRRAMDRDYSLLKEALNDKTMYNYCVQYPNDLGGQRNNYDHSVSQYGVLGMWALEESGVQIPSTYWRAIEAAWKRDQLQDGGWDYHRDWHEGDPLESTPAMTEAGLATLFLAQDEEIGGMSTAACRGNVKDAAIDRGMDWMAGHFDGVFQESPELHNPCYALYGLERIGVASGRVYFKDIDWYARGADYLCERQKLDGSWAGGVSDTALGLLFLVRGGAPVTINKLQYFNDMNGKPQEGNWNERPRDVANFNPWLASQVEFPHVLNWQVLRLDASPADLHSAPVLLVDGNMALRFSEADQQKLKKYIDQGGLVLFNADGGSKAFSDSVIALASRLYPEEFRELTRDDVIFSHEQFRMSNPPRLLALSNGIRELMILAPNADVSGGWQEHKGRSHESECEVGANIVMYACDKTGILHKGDSYIVEADPNVTAQKTVKVARIQYNGVWDPEPQAWVRMSAIMHNTLQVDLAIDAVSAGQGKLAGHDVAVLTGTETPSIEKGGWDEIRDFVQNGGTLIVDGAGGSAESTFTKAVHDELVAEFPAEAGGLETALAFSDDFYTKVGASMTEVHFRPYSRTVLADLSTPQLRAMKFGNRFGVFFSKEDLTEGLVGQHVDGVVGYEPETAAELVEKMVLSAGAK